MATLEQIGIALKRAAAAGDTAAATKLAAAYKAAAAQSAPAAQDGGFDPVTAPNVDDARLPMMGAYQPPQRGFGQAVADNLSAGFISGVEALPIIGPWAKDRLEESKAGLHGVSLETIQGEDKRLQSENQIASGVGAVTGTVLPFVAGGAIPAVAKGLGMAGSLPTRIVAGGASNAVIGGADTLARGGTMEDAGRSALISGGIGAAAAPIGDLVGAGLNAAGSKVKQVWNSAFNPDVAAQKAVSGAAAADIGAGKAMTAADEASAALNSQPVINADRFGTHVKQLARTAANANSAARNTLDDVVGDRFKTQSGRAVDFVKRIAPGYDDVQTLEALQGQARQVNAANYDRAYSSPAAKAVWTPEIKTLFQSPDFVEAIKAADRTAANEAAASGVKAVRNPFTFDANGNIGLRNSPDGSVAIPNLEFWDIVQRNLRAKSETAFAGGDKLLGGQIKELRRQLLASLDSAVPAFRTARQGAAKAFGAEDALEAGKKFLSQKMGIPEARKAHALMSAAEKKLFATGFASELLDKLGASSDRVNVINQVFGSPAARAQIELALGKPAVQQLEQFVRIEDIMHMTKNEVTGGPTTARQLIASGMLGGAGGAVVGNGDPSTIFTGAMLTAAGRAGVRAMGQALDQKVMARVADILVSNDPAQINRVILNATLSKEHAAAIKAIQTGLQAMLKGGAVSFGGQSVAAQ